MSFKNQLTFGDFRNQILKRYVNILSTHTHTHYTKPSSEIFKRRSQVESKAMTKISSDLAIWYSCTILQSKHPGETHRTRATVSLKIPDTGPKSTKGASRNPFHLNFMILLFEFPVQCLL